MTPSVVAREEYVSQLIDTIDLIGSGAPRDEIDRARQRCMFLCRQRLLALEAEAESPALPSFFVATNRSLLQE